MYTAIVDGKYLFHPQIKECSIYNPVVRREVNKTGSFDFDILPNNPVYGSIRKITSIIEVYDDNELIFRGRPLNDATGIDMLASLQCEGELGYLNDSVLDPYEFTGSVRDLVSFYISMHNQQVDEARRFVVGNVTVTEAANVVVRSNIEYTKTWEEMSQKLFESSLGGYLMLRRENGVNYIDYLKDSGRISGQSVELSKNMLEFNKEVTSENIVTVLIPLGAKKRDENGNEMDERITIESVNAGSKYIVNQEGVNKYGTIVGYQVWDDVNIPLNLLTKGKESLDFQVSLGLSLKIRALDLNLVDKTIPKLRFFEYVEIISKPHGIELDMLIKRQTIDLVSPEKNTIEVGVDIRTFVDKQLENDRVIKEIKANYITNEQVGKIVNPVLIQVSKIAQEASLIQVEVSQLKKEVGSENIIPSFNGENGYDFWRFSGYALHPKSNLYPSSNLFPKSSSGQIFEIVRTNKLSQTGFKFVKNGVALSGFGFVLPDIDHSMRINKISGAKSLIATVIEYDSSYSVIKEHRFLVNELGVNDFTIPKEELNPFTNWMKVKYEVQNLSNNEFILISDSMLNRGIPKDWTPSVNDVHEYARSGLKVLSDNVEIYSKKTDEIDGRTYNTTLKLSAEEGVEIQSSSGKGLTIRDDNGNATVTLNTDGTLRTISMEAINAVVSGMITATSGAVGGFSIEDGELVGDDIRLSKSKIQIGNAFIRNFNQDKRALHVDTDQLSILPNENGGITLRDYLGQPTTKWVIHRNYENDKTIGYFDRLNSFDRASEIFSYQDIVLNGTKKFKGRLEGSVDTGEVGSVFTSGVMPLGSVPQIGLASNRWNNIYLLNQPSVSSDVRTKYNMTAIDDLLLDEFEKVEEKMFVTKHDDLFSFGYSAQDVERALYKFCLKVWGWDEANEWLLKFKLLHKSESYLSLLYNEVQIIKQAVKHRKIDRLIAKEADQDEEINKLKNEVSELKQILIDKGVI